MNIKKLVLPAVVAAVSLLSANLGFANESGMPPPPPPKKVECHKQKHKPFSPEKKEKIKNILKSHKGEMKPLMEKMHVLRKAIQAEYKKEAPSWPNIQTSIEQLAEAQAGLMLNKEKIRFEVYEKTGFLLPAKKMHQN